MNSVVASVLNKTLGEFIENLDPSQLNLSIFDGTVNLTGLTIKPSFINSMAYNLSLPFELIHGYIGKIFINIPWKNLSS